MPEATAPPPLPKSQPSFGKRHSTIIKLLGVGALVLVLLIPLLMITGVLNDRLSRQNEAVADITSSWGRRTECDRAGLGYSVAIHIQIGEGNAGAGGETGGARGGR